MAKGQAYPWERKFFSDEVTGVRLVRLTSFPTVNMKFYFHWNAFTPDSKTLVFLSYRYAQRNSPVDAFRVDVDGTNLVQLTDSPELGGPVVSPDGKWLYFVCRGELHRVSLATCEEEVIGYIEGVRGAGSGSISADGTRYIADATLENGRRAIIRYCTNGKGQDIILEMEDISHTQYEPSESKVILFSRQPDSEHRNMWLVNDDGTNLRVLNLPYGNGHFMWLGPTKRVMTNLTSDRWGISVMGENDLEPETVVTGEHFWHASCSMDGKWMISDTNWPDHGLQLINVRTGKFRALCYPGSSSCHPQWTHPHPSFSPDGKIVVFNSDRTGIPHVYLAIIPDEIFEELQGYS